MKFKITKDAVIQFIKDSLMSFVYWTIVLTPYMVFIVGVTLAQYFAWVAGGAMLLPFLGAIYSLLVRKIPFMNQECRSRIIRFLRDAAATFVFFTAMFTPYMVFIMGMGLAQYLAWVGMQLILVPPLGILYTYFVRKLGKNRQ